jgi:hypothetical protein
MNMEIERTSEHRRVRIIPGPTGRIREIVIYSYLEFNEKRRQILMHGIRLENHRLRRNCRQSQK